MASFAVRLLLLGVTILLCLAAAEIALRVVGFSAPPFYMANQLTGGGLAPGVEGWYTREGEAFITINSAGLRDQEHFLTNPGNAYRIAVLGDSYSEAFQVDLADTFWSVMERDLGACPPLEGRTVEAINFGVSGLG